MDLHGARGSRIAAQAMGQSSWQRTGPAHVAFPLFNFFDLFFDLLLLVVHRDSLQIKILKRQNSLEGDYYDDLRKSWDLHRLEHVNIALLQDFAVSSPAKRAKRYVHNKIGFITCLKHHLAVIAILCKAVVVAVLHLVIGLADLLLLGVEVAVVHLELIGFIPDDAEVDLHLILVVGEVVLSVPEVPISVGLKLGGMVIDKFFSKSITMTNDTMVTSIPWRSLKHCRWQR